MQDFLLNADGSMKIANGDFVIGDSESQDIELIITSQKGDWKENPLVGVGIGQLIKSRATETKIKKEIDQQLTNDGFKSIDINIEYPEVYVDANR